MNTPLRSKVLSHTRSSSLPSRSHPLIPQFNDHLQKLSSCESTSPSSLSSITKKLQLLDGLYNCLDDLLLLPHTQQVFARESNEKWVEEVLDGYLALVDACATAKDSLFHAKEFVLDCHSVVRRMRLSLTTDDLCRFFQSRKTTKKMIHMFLRNINSFRSKTSVTALDKEKETVAVISMLKEAESVTLDLIETLLVSISGSKGSRISGWSLVSKLMNTRKISGEFGELDATLYKLVTSKCDATTMQVDELQQLLKEMDVSIRVVEDELEFLFKRLIKTRVSLLNMHSL